MAVLFCFGSNTLSYTILTDHKSSRGRGFHRTHIGTSTLGQHSGGFVSLLLFFITYPELVEVPRRWEICWCVEMPVFSAFVKELSSMALSLLPSTMMLCVSTLISANITGPGDELDVTFQNKS